MEAIVSGPGDGEPLRYDDRTIRIKAVQPQLDVLEFDVDTGYEGPGPHYHERHVDSFYVLEGELEFQVADARVTARAGELAFAPRGEVHTLANLSDAPARYLLLCTPAGFERYFDRIAARQAGTEPPSEALKPYPETIVVGPPLGA
jgi:quercetin dioxygenase-like cupin family protein